MKLFRLAAIAALLLAPSVSHASILGSALTSNGTEDRLSTISPAGLATLVNVDGSTDGMGNDTFTDGDVVFGFLVSSLGTNDFLTGSASAMDFQSGYAVAMFAAQLETGSGGFNLVTPVTTAGLRLADLVDPVFGAALAGVADDAMVAVISGDIGGSPLDGILNANAADGLSFFSSADFELELAANTADAGSGAGFFQFAGGGGTVGQQRGGFNVIDGVGAIGNASNYLDVAVASLFAPPPTTSAHIGLDTTLVNAGNAATGRGWAFETQSFGIRLNTVPEPTSMIGFAGLFGLGLMRRRRS